MKEITINQNKYQIIQLPQEEKHLPWCPVFVPHNVGGFCWATAFAAPGVATKVSEPQFPVAAVGPVSSKSVKSSLIWQISKVKKIMIILALILF